MFDLIFQGAQAYNQVGFFIGAVVCLGIGGLILGNSFYWRVHALRAQGTVIGVIANGGDYIPVYRYTSADGQIHVAKSDTARLARRSWGSANDLRAQSTQAREASHRSISSRHACFVVPVAMSRSPRCAHEGSGGHASIHGCGYRVLIPEREAALHPGVEKRQYRPDDLYLSNVKPIETPSGARGSASTLRQSQSYKKVVPIWPLSLCPWDRRFPEFQDQPA
jgi:hypothetical protein